MFEQDLEGLNRHREQTVEDIKELLKTNQRVACVRYTGYGKSYYIIRKLIEEIDGQKIIVVPNDTLKLHYQEQYKGNKSVIILTYQIIKNKTTENIQNDYNNVSLIIADECHHITAEKWCTEFQRLENIIGAKVVGLTATPERGNKVNVVDKFFDNVEVKPLDLLEGISLGFVPKIKYIIAYASLEDKKDLIDSKMKEIDRYKILNLLKVENILKEEISKEHLESNLKILVFVPRISDIEEGRYKSLNWFKTIYPDKTINIYSIDSKTSSVKNEKQLNEFKKLHNSNNIDIMVSVNKLIEGLHLPTVSIEILLRKTKSSVVYFQQVGRVINSKQPIVFDLINNTAHLHRIKDEYDINSRYISEINKCTGRKKKVMYEDCIELIYKTVEIDDILKRYKYSQKDIILQNRDYIEENPDRLSHNKMSKYLQVNPLTFKKYCQALSIDIYSNYTKPWQQEEFIKILLNNKQYIEENPDKLSHREMGNYLHIKNRTTFEKYCSLLDIDITSAYRRCIKRTKEEFIKILLSNKKYIEENPNKLSYKGMSKYLQVNPLTFKKYCQELNIDITTTYNTYNLVRYSTDITLMIIKNKKYVEENPDNLTVKLMCKEFANVSEPTFRKLCRKLNIDLYTNYPNSRYRRIEEIKSILEKNRKYIEENPDNLSLNKMYEFLELNRVSFKRYCLELDIDISSNYTTGKSENNLV